MLIWRILLKSQYEAQLELSLFSWTQSSAGNTPTIKTGQYFSYWMHNNAQLSLAILTSLPPYQCSSSALQAHHGVRKHQFSNLYGWIDGTLLVGENGKVGLHLDDLDNAVVSLCITWLMLVFSWRQRQRYRGRTILDTSDRTRTDSMSRPSQVGGDNSQLEWVASRGRFVVFVALQGERRNANIKVRAVSPFNTKSPPHMTTGGL